jgi:uncharacterized damage-inducible protein DinB
MTRKQYLKFAKGIYQAARGLIQLTPDEKLGFRPKEGLMSIAQVLKHIASSLGVSASMAINNTWPDIPEDEMLPPVEKMPASVSVNEALEEIDNDWKLLEKEIERITDGEFNQNTLKVPWMPHPMLFWEFMMQAAEHLSNHRMQLFIWLKLAGENLNTGHLYGMH